MFDGLLSDPGALRHASDAAVVTAIEDFARLEAAASARRLEAIAELTSRRCDKEDERAHWACDSWDFVAAEVAAALGVSHRKASSQMQLGLTLRRLLPKIDTALAERATPWERLSDYKLSQAIDFWIDRYYPGALRRIQTRARGRGLEAGSRDDDCDTTAVWGRRRCWIGG